LLGDEKAKSSPEADTISKPQSVTAAGT
jgi:hypothetical protein